MLGSQDVVKEMPQDRVQGRTQLLSVSYGSTFECEPLRCTNLINNALEIPIHLATRTQYLDAHALYLPAIVRQTLRIHCCSYGNSGANRIVLVLMICTQYRGNITHHLSKQAYAMKAKNKQQQSRAGSGEILTLHWLIVGEVKGIKKNLN